MVSSDDGRFEGILIMIEAETNNYSAELEWLRLDRAARIEREADLIATATHAGAEAYELRKQLARWRPIVEAMARKACDETWQGMQSTHYPEYCPPCLARAELARLNE